MHGKYMYLIAGYIKISIKYCVNSLISVLLTDTVECCIIATESSQLFHIMQGLSPLLDS